MKESNIERLIMMAAPKLGARLFRNNQGMGWVGKSVRISERQTVTLMPGDVVVRQARPLHAGVGPAGAADQIGWMPVQITADMVGQRVAVFTSVEVKSVGKSARTEQEAWANAVRAAGGIAGVCRSEEDLRGLLCRGIG